MRNRAAGAAQGARRRAYLITAVSMPRALTNKTRTIRWPHSRPSFITHEDPTDAGWCICAAILSGCSPNPPRTIIAQELSDWQRLAVLGHHAANRPWISYHERAAPVLAALVGAEETEVVAMNSLTVNLHLMMVSFFQARRRAQSRAHRKIGVSIRSLRDRLAARVSRSQRRGAFGRGRAAHRRTQSSNRGSHRVPRAGGPPAGARVVARCSISHRTGVGSWRR